MKAKKFKKKVLKIIAQNLISLRLEDKYLQAIHPDAFTEIKKLKI